MRQNRLLSRMFNQEYDNTTQKFQNIEFDDTEVLAAALRTIDVSTLAGGSVWSTGSAYTYTTTMPIEVQAAQRRPRGQTR